MVSSHNGKVLRCDGESGDVIAPDFITGLSGPSQAKFGPDGNLYVCDSGGVRIYEETTGVLVRSLEKGGALDYPFGLAFDSAGNLYASNLNTDAIVRWNGSTWIEFVPSARGGLDGPYGLGFGPDGNLYVTSCYSNQILRYSGTDGTFMDAFASGPQLQSPTDLLFIPEPFALSLLALGALPLIRRRRK